MKRNLARLVGIAMLVGGIAVAAPQKPKDESGEHGPNVLVIQQFVSGEGQVADVAATQAYAIPMREQTLPSAAGDETFVADRCGRNESFALKLKLEPMRPGEVAEIIAQHQEEPGDDNKAAKQPSWGFYYGLGYNGFGGYYGYNNYNLYGLGYGGYYGYNPYGYYGSWGYGYGGNYWPYNYYGYRWWKGKGGEKILCSVYVRAAEARRLPAK